MDPENPYAAPLIPAGELPVDAAARPLTLLGALNTGTALYVRRFPTVAAVTLTVWAPLEVLISYLEYFVLDPEDIMGALRLSLMADGLVGIISTGAVISVGEAELRGEQRGWLAGLGDGLRAWPRLFGTRLVSGIALVLAALLFILPAIYFTVRFSLAETTAVIERKVGMNAISRSMELTRGRFLTFLGLCLCTITPILVLGGVTELPLVFYPMIDHWLLSAALTCMLDMATPWILLVFVAAYMHCLAEERREQAVAQGTSDSPTQVVIDIGRDH